MHKYQIPDKDVLEYHHPPLAAQGPFYQLARHTRNSSAQSTSSSEYSSLSDSKDSDVSSQVSHITRRSSLPPAGTVDRRQIAMAQAEQNTPITPIPSHLHSTTLQDTQSSSDLVNRANAPLSNPDATNSPLSHHNRSASEFLPSSKIPSRDIGIVGTVTGVKQQGSTQMPSKHNNNHSPPIFQELKSTSPALPSTPDLTLPLAPVRGLNIMKRVQPKEDSANASRLGEDKENCAPAEHLGLDTAADLLRSGIRLVPRSKPEQAQTPDFATPSPLISPTSSSDPTLLYVNYQPGIHSTAGPLPPPPRLPGFDALAASSSSPPPPRPPRLNSPLPPRNAARLKDIEVVKQALQLPPSVSAALASRDQKVSLPDAVNSLAPKEIVDSVTPAAVARSTSKFATPSSPSISDTSSSSYCMLQHTSPIHRREGAFLSSWASTDAGSDSHTDSVRGASETSSNTIPKLEQSSNGDVPQVISISEPSPPSPILESAAEDVNDDGSHLRQLPQSNRGQDHGELTDKSADGDEQDSNEHWVSVSRASSPPSCGDGLSPGTAVNVNDESNNIDINREFSGALSEAPSPPPKNFRNSLTTGLKRFSSRSLPRTPSVSSGSRRSSSIISKRFSTQSENQSGLGSGGLDLPSPSLHSVPSPSHVVNNDLHASNAGFAARERSQARATRKKVVQQWPPAMSCNEIHARGNKMTPGEKCAIYTRKINELYIYDCGLSGWVEEMKFRGPNYNQHGNGTSNKKFLDARSPTDSLFVPKPRQTSRSSMISEATFPTRPDASTATDLLSPSHDNNDGYLEDIPILPYPSLATAQRAAASNVPANPTPPASIRSYDSNSTLPSVTVISSNNAHAPVNTLTSSTQSPGTTLHHASASLPLNRSFTTSAGGGFFASLSRKASLSSTKKPAPGIGLNFKSSNSSSPTYPTTMSPSAIQRHSTKSSLGNPGVSRSTASIPVSVGGIAMDRSAPPSIVPGGPRALSNSGSVRLQRSKTYIPSKSPHFNSVGSSSPGGIHDIERRPSLRELQSNYATSGLTSPPASTSTTPMQNYLHYTPSLSSPLHQGQGVYTPVDQSDIQFLHNSEPIGYIQPQQQQQLLQLQQPSVYDPQTDLEFVRQINKLAELLPNANRMVLTGYLRRAGQDVLAIGQYLEDEKNGTLKAY